MTKRSEADRIRQLTESLSGNIKAAFEAFLKSTRSEAMYREVANLLEAGRVEDAITATERYVRRLGMSIPETIRQAGAIEVAALESKFGQHLSQYGVTFDPGDRKAASIMADSALEFIREFTNEQRKATQQVLIASLEEGLGPRDTARRLTDIIGLTSRQAAAVAKYRAILSDPDTMNDALYRDLRNRTYDRTVRSALRRGVPLTPIQIDRMTNAYIKNYLKYRGETIARTEGQRAVNEGRHLGLGQVQQQAEIPDDRVRRQWNATGDPRTRDSHGEMDEQQVRSDEPFTSGDGYKLMYPGDSAAPAAEVINCRCVVTFEILPPGQAVDTPVEDVDALSPDQVMQEWNDLRSLNPAAKEWGIPEAQIWTGATGGMSPKMIYEKIKNNLPGNGTGVFRMFDPHTPSNLTYYYNQNNRIKITRKLDFGTKTAVHDTFVIAKNLQGKGMAKTFLKDSVDMYKDLGINRVLLDANVDVGGYAWARYGFVPVDAHTSQMLSKNLTNRLKDLNTLSAPGQISPSDLSIVQDHITRLNTDPTAIWDIADLRLPIKDAGGKTYPLGSMLLRGTSWNGALDMTNPVVMKRFQSYVE